MGPHRKTVVTRESIVGFAKSKLLEFLAPGFHDSLRRGMLMVQRYDDLLLAIKTHLSRNFLDEKGRRHVDELVRDFGRTSPWRKTYDVVSSALAREEATLARENPKSRIRVRFVATLGRLYILGTEPGEPFVACATELIYPGDLSRLRHELQQEASHGAAVSNDTSDSASTGARLGDRLGGDRTREPIPVAHHVNVVFVNARPTSGQMATDEQIVAETLRRAPATATIWLVYEVVDPGNGGNADREIRGVSLKISRLDFICDTQGWNSRATRTPTTEASAGDKKR